MEKLDAELKRLISQKVNKSQDQDHGKSLMRMMFQKLLIGETSKERTSSHGARINTSQSIVDHAGLKELLQLLLIDLTLLSMKLESHIHKFHSQLKLLLTVKPEDHAMEETQEVFIHLPRREVSHMIHVNNTLHTMKTTKNSSALISISVETVLDQLHQLVMMALTNVGLLNITLITMLKITMESQELTK